MTNRQISGGVILWIARCFLHAHICMVLTDGSGVAAQQEELQIYGGENIRKKEYPWFAVLRRVEDSQLVCSGALIGSRHVVTASHCIENVGSILVEVGYWCTNRGNCGRDSDFIGVRDTFRHAGGGDFALLVLDRAVNFDVTPAVPYLGPKLHPSQSRLKKGREMDFVGAGREGGRGSNVSLFVKKLKVKYLKPKACRRRLKDPSYVTEYDICSVPQNGNSCSGDSGAALVVPGKGLLKKRDVILAIHKFGQTLCADAENPLAGHFRISEAAKLIRRVVCKGQFPEDWCNPKKNSNNAGEDDRGEPPTAAPVVNRMDEEEDSNKDNNPGTVGSIEKIELLHTWTNHTGSVMSVAFNSDSSKIISGSCDNSIKIWNLAATAEEEDVNAPPDVTTLNTVDRHCFATVRFSPVSDSLAVSGTFSALAKRWNTFTGQSTVEFRPHGGAIWSVRWSHDGNRILSAAHDGSAGVREFNAFDGTVISTMGRQELGLDGVGRAHGLDTHPTDIEKVAASYESLVAIRARTATGNHTFFHWVAHPSAVVYSVAYSSNGKLLATAASDGSVRVWDDLEIDDGESPVLLGEFLGHSSAVKSVAWSPKGHFLVSGSDDGTIRLWNVATATQNRATASSVPQTPFLTLEAHSSFVESVDWSSNGLRLVSGSEDATIRVWRVHGLVED